MLRRLPAPVSLTLAGLVMALSALAAAPALAHTEVLRASPSPGEEVSAPVDRVELTFLDPVEPDPTITVGTGVGEPIADMGEVELTEDRRTASVGFPALEDTGDYVIEYAFMAADGDTQRETYRFSIVRSVDGADSGGGAGAVVGGVALAVVLAIGVGTALLRRNRPS